MYSDIEDLIESQPADKTMHDWEQSTIEAEHIIKPLTVEGQTILDPFMGYGTFGVAALTAQKEIHRDRNRQRTLFKCNSTIKQIYSPADTTSARTTEIMRSPSGIGRIFAAVSKDLERSYFMGAFRRSQHITYWHKLLRQYKKPFILLTKREEPKLYFHCSNHRGARLIKTDKGLLCPQGCGYTSPAIRIVDTWQG